MAARAPLALEPASKWQLNYGPERCTLTRDLGSGSSAVHVQFDSFGSWNEFRMQLSGPAIPAPYGPVGSASVRMSSDAFETPTSTLQGKVGNEPSVSFSVGFAPSTLPAVYKRMSREQKLKLYEAQRRPQPEYDATVDGIDVRLANGPTLALQLGNMAAPLAALRACIDDMYKSWGIDPAQQKALSHEARPTNATVSSVKSDYPSEPLLNSLSAYVPVRLTIDATGKPTLCVVQVESVGQAFKTAVCSHLQGRYEPALDANGQPVTSLFHTSVFYFNHG